MSAPRPYNLVAELTYRCPLRCVYCSNPIDYAETRDALDAQDWARVFHEAAELGVVHVGLTGGEPTTRSDLAEIVAAAHTADLYTHLITAGTPITEQGLASLRDAGLRSVQLSLQDVALETADEVAGVRMHETKLEFARAVRKLDLPLVLNVVVHRKNLDRTGELIELAHKLDAQRLELANAQYYGWALHNRAALLPTRAQLERARELVQSAQAKRTRPEILFTHPDYWSERPKPCMGGWGQKIMVVNPAGRVLPCHAAAELPGLEFWSVREHSLRACWSEAPGMNVFRGQDWMREPCRSCPERARDFGGCRCQAFLLTGDARATDPACQLSPHHAQVERARHEAAAAWRYRGS